MKYLICEESFKVLMKGKAVTESKLSNDFVYDTKNKDGISIASMREIAEANGFKIKGKKSTEVKNSFDTELEKLKLPEKREMSQTEKINAIVKEGHESGKSEDEILISIVQSGVKFQIAAKMMKQALIDLGMSISPKDRYVKAKVMMEDEDFSPETYEDVSLMTKKLAKEVPNTNEKQALAAIRKFCKELEVDVPKKPKETGAPFGIQVIVWIAQNLEAEVDEFEEWLEEKGKKEKTVEAWSKKFAAIKAEAEKTPAEDDEDQD